MSANGVWLTRGFESFRKGTFGNAGQNLYVSRAGVLQRIHQYDFNKDGYIDLIFCNSQAHWEKPPAYVYPHPLSDAAHRVELPAEGARAGAVADLNGDGHDDIIIGNYYNGIRFELNSTIYYGSPDGWGEQRVQHLPTKRCTSVAAGDFNGDGKPDLAFLCDGEFVRLFYQSPLGFEPKRYADLAIEAQSIGADDLDGDGHAELIVRSKTGQVSIYWGGAGGLDLNRVTVVPVPDAAASAAADEQAKYAEYVEDAAPQVPVLRLGGAPHLFVARPAAVYLVPVNGQRQFGAPLTLACSHALAAALGDVNGDGQPDLVLACRQPHGAGERSWVYWGGAGGFSEERKTPLDSFRASDVAVADLDGDGCADIVLCQSHTKESFTAESYIYRGARDGAFAAPVRLVSHDARRVLLPRPAPGATPHVVLVNYFARNLMGDIPVYIYTGSAAGYAPERRIELPGWGALEAICTDFNDDGWPDVLLANASENSVGRDPGSFLYLNGPEGFADVPSQRLPTQRAHGVACADINRDGYLDLIFCGFSNDVLTIVYGSANGFDTANPVPIRMEHEGVVYDDPRWVYLADLNGDGWLDLVVPQISFDRSFILWGGPDGFSMARAQWLSVFHAACARAADLNGNGYLDLILGGHMPSEQGPHDSFLYIYWNGPDGLREDRRTLLPAKTINALSVADFNNDGALDIFICSYHAVAERDIDAYLYWNRRGKFAAEDRERMFTHSSSGCFAADFNEDGRIDLAIANHKVWGDHVGWSAVWWNGPDGFDEKRITTLPTSGPHGMASVEPGNLMDRGPEEYYVSAPFQLPAAASITGIAWQADLAPKTWVRAQLRFAETEDGLTDAPWLGPVDGESWFQNGQTMRLTAFRGQWLQYRLALGATNGGGTPRVREVAVHYREIG